MTPLNATNMTPKQATAQRTQKKSLTDTQFAILLVLPALMLLVVIILYPLLNSMYLGFFDKSLVYPGQEFVGLKNIKSVLNGDFLLILTNTLIFTFWATILPFLIGFGVALLLNSAIRGRGILRGAFLLPWLVPSVIVSFLWLWIFNANYGVLNGALRSLGIIESNINFLSSTSMAMFAVIIAKTWQTFPWMAIMILAGLQTIPRDLIEAAAIDGASKLKTFTNVTIPHLRGIISITLLLSFIWNFQHLETIYVMTQGGPAKATTTFAIAVYQTGFQAFDLGKAGAIGILWMMLLSIIVIIYLRYGMDDEAEA
jgi:multiple sugar transport system permease protein